MARPEEQGWQFPGPLTAPQEATPPAALEPGPGAANSRARPAAEARVGPQVHLTSQDLSKKIQG